MLLAWGPSPRGGWSRVSPGGRLNGRQLLAAGREPDLGAVVLGGVEVGVDAVHHLRAGVGVDGDPEGGPVLRAPEGQPVEIAWGHCPNAGEMDAYERVLGDAMAGDATLFAREDYVEEAWRIVDPVVKAGTPVFEYEPRTWGPAEVGSVTPPGGWHNPMPNGC